MQLPDLIEEIYDAALEPALWNDVIVGINAFVGGQACGLISKDSTSQFGFTHYYCGADPHFIQLYAETHSKFDPLSVLPPLGKVTGIPDLVAYDEYRKGRFYQEWLKPQGCVDAARLQLGGENEHRDDRVAPQVGIVIEADGDTVFALECRERARDRGGATVQVRHVRAGTG